MGRFTMNQPQSFSNLAYVSTGQPRSVDRNEWYTPMKYIEAARKVLGVIDFDPYSDHIANQVVKASAIRTKPGFDLFPPGDHALWPECQTVWMNPPYGKGEIEQAVSELIFEYNRQQFQAIVLVNNATETRWFQTLLQDCAALCLTDHRIAFSSVDSKAVSSNTRGQAFMYFGNLPEPFIREFSRFGFTIATRHHHDTLRN